MALTIGWLAALAVAIVGDTTRCSPSDPSLCGPDQTFAAAIVLLFATPVLLRWQPLAGCVAGVGFAVLDEVFDQLHPANLAFGVHGTLCLLTAAWMVSARRRQRRVIAALHPSSSTLPPGAFREWWGPRLLASAVLVAAGAGLLGLYAHLVAVERRHLDRAVPTEARVISIDDDNSTITLESPLAGRRRISVVDTTSYPEGSTVALLIEPSDRRWARLVAEPSDDTDWESAGLGCLLLAVLLWWRELAGRRARRRLLDGKQPVLAVRVGSDRDGNALVFPAEARARKPLAIMAVRWSSAEPDDLEPLEESWDDAVADAEEVAEFGRAWRGESRGEDGGEALAPGAVTPSHRRELEPATVVGEFVDGGWVALVTEHEVLLPERPLRLAQPSLRSQWRRWPWGRRTGGSRNPAEGPPPAHGSDGDWIDAGRFPGRAVTAGDPEILKTQPGLPHLLRPARRQRLAGLVMLLSLVVVPIAVAVGLPEGWYEHLVVIALGGFLAFDGLERAIRDLRLTRQEITVTTAMRIHHIPWEQFHGVRVDHQHLYLAWGPGLAMRVGPFETAGSPEPRSRRLEQVGAWMMTLRARALAAGSPGRPVRSTPGPGVVMLAGYALLVIASLWWRWRFGPAA